MRNYGFFIDLTRGFDQAFPDFWRFKEWEREFNGFAQHQNLPSLELLRIEHDHFGSFRTAVDGVNTFATQMADNDYALGLIVDKVAHSPFKNNTLIFVVEDDAQDGPDHVDAHRSIAYVVGPYVKQGALVSARFTTVNMLRSIVDVLGLKPLGIHDATAEPMSDVFQTTLVPWSFTAIVPQVLRSTSLPLPPSTMVRNDSGSLRLPTSGLLDNPAYLAQKTQGMDFSKEDDLNVQLFNHILWQAMRGDVPYPTTRNGRDLRSNRKELLKQFEPVKLEQPALPILSTRN